MLKVIKETLLSIREAKQPELSFSSLVEYLKGHHVTHLSVNYSCVYGGGGIIPLNSDNINDHLNGIQTHLSHGDRIIFTTFADKPVIEADGKLQVFETRIDNQYKLIP